MKRDLKKKLLLFSFMLYLTLNVESRHEVNGTSEENITVKFTFQDSDINSKPRPIQENQMQKTHQFTTEQHNSKGSVGHPVLCLSAVWSMES
ncbi:hypothetical protein Q8A67_006215 [Cirrhinus molitorella]|uniref:Uncharacterized protein n=1 Tax=Cirrhinus molitorella TaxID=172907 RepID=A0AA88Q5R4_9TELE|nr:hypothetical protein Q8A67_006215 [Cirrhinus molitorella]